MNGTTVGWVERSGFNGAIPIISASIVDGYRNVFTKRGSTHTTNTYLPTLQFLSLSSAPNATLA
jgi:hypothetical protein